MILMQLLACVHEKSNCTPFHSLSSLSEAWPNMGQSRCTVYTKVASHLLNEEYIECKISVASSMVITMAVYVTILG